MQGFSVANEVALGLTLEYENSRPVMENMISPTVMTKYCGMSHSMCKLFSLVRMKDLRMGFEPSDLEMTRVETPPCSRTNVPTPTSASPLAK